MVCLLFKSCTNYTKSYVHWKCHPCNDLFRLHTLLDTILPVLQLHWLLVCRQAKPWMDVSTYTYLLSSHIRIDQYSVTISQAYWHWWARVRILQAVHLHNNALAYYSQSCGYVQISQYGNRSKCVSYTVGDRTSHEHWTMHKQSMNHISLQNGWNPGRIDEFTTAKFGLAVKLPTV